MLAQDFAEHDALQRRCQALLVLSDTIAERCGLLVNDFAESKQWRSDWPFGLPQLLQRGATVRFSDTELMHLGVDIADLEPFCVVSLDGLLDAPFGATVLCRQPLIRHGGTIHLPVPSLISPALRLYLAHAIADHTVPQKATTDFHTHQFARWVGIDLALRKAKPLLMTDVDLPEPDLDIPGLEQAVLRFDQDKLLNIFVLECDWRHPPNFAIHDTRRATPKSEKALGDYLKQVHDKLAKDHGTTRGLTLVIENSPGWNVNVQLPVDFNAEWFCVGMHAHSFSFLLDDPSFSPIELWKMLREHREMVASGVQVAIWPDMLAYWSIWLTLDHTFWPRGLDLRAFGGLIPDTSKIVEVMHRIRVTTASHAAPLPSGEWLRVERWIEELSPSQDYTKPIFFDPISLVLGDLRCVIETDRGRWWVAIIRPPFDPEDRQFLYLLWQGAAEWLLRIARSAESRLALSGEPLEVGLLPTHKSLTGAPADMEVEAMSSQGKALVSLPASFFESLVTVDNSGEKVLVAALIDAVLAARGTSLPNATKATWTANVTADPHLKMLHITPANDAGFAADLVTGKIGLRFLQTTDQAAAVRFMRDALTAVSASGVDQNTETIMGAPAVRAVLHVAVDVHWARCRTMLRTMDREVTLVLISRLIEAIHRERVTSERAAQARSRHYAESPEFDVLARSTMGRRDAAFQAYRTVAEMALCECPLAGGRIPGLTDIDTLAAEVAALVRVAHESDAVERGLVPPSIAFGADGTIHPQDGGADAFIRPYVMASFGESIALDIDAYAALFEERGAERDVTIDEDDPFFRAFKAEFGLSLRCAVEICHALQALVAQQNRDTLAMRRSHIEQLLAALSPPIQKAHLALFLDAFGLVPRPTWDGQPQPPYTYGDIWPWIFERRLSLMLKPVLVVSTAPDPVLVYGVRQIDMGVRYASILLETGIWPKEKLISSEARSFVDGEANRRGALFELEIAELVRDAGWNAIGQITPRCIGAAPQLGDLDVLAISPDGHQWCVIECKWFGAARTPREIASWLQDFRGNPGDKLDRHLRRVAWVREHRVAVAALLGLPVVADKIDGKIVTTSPVPLALLVGLPAGSDVLPRRELKSALASS